MFNIIPTYPQINSVKLILTGRSNFSINFTLIICAYVGMIINIVYVEPTGHSGNH